MRNSKKRHPVAIAPQTPAMYCEHANEVPMACPCKANCYCRAHTCRIAVVIDAETRPLWETAKRAAQEVAAWPAWKHTEQPKETAVRPASKKRRVTARRAREARESASLSRGGRHRVDVSEREAIEVSRLHAPLGGVTAAVNAQMQTPEAWRETWADVKHCDDYIDDEGAHPALRAYLDRARSPGHGMTSPEPFPRLFADHSGSRVRVVMASRMGDVGITTVLTAEYGYEARVSVGELSNFGDSP